MSKKNTQDQFDAVNRCVTEHPEGVSFEVIFNDLKSDISRRTLQRRLAALVQNGLIRAQGKARAVRYYAASPVKRGETAQDKCEGIPLSDEGAALLQKMTLPLNTRPHVSYNREFLDAYVPNKTYYLDEAVRRRLFDLGKPAGGERPAGTYARQIFSRLLIDLSWNSSRLEGNTYSLLETERLLQFGEPAEGKDRKEAQMILNHKEAIEFLIDSADYIGINRYTIMNLHALLSADLLPDARSSGTLRKIPVGIAQSTYHPLEVPQIVEECFNQILDWAGAITDPFEQAFFLTVHLPYLQPFEDVNKRVSRLAANIPLIKSNFCPLSFVEVPDDVYITGLLAVYELNRVELLRDVFVWAYERSSSLYSATRRALGEPDPFRVRYRTLILDTVKEIVTKRKDRRTAAKYIEQQTARIESPHDRPRFAELLERELISIHEGNIARYRIRPSEYTAWHTIWLDQR